MWNFNKQEFFGKLFLTAPCENGRRKTTRKSCGIIYLTLSAMLQRQPNMDARVVELVDSLASGASARKGVRVRLPPRAPNAERQKNLEIERFRDFLLLLQAKMLRFYRSAKTGILEFINFLSTSLKRSGRSGHFSKNQ